MKQIIISVTNRTSACYPLYVYISDARWHMCLRSHASNKEDCTSSIFLKYYS